MTEEKSENTDLEPRHPGLDEDEPELSSRQIEALEKLDELGAAPRQDPDEAYSRDPRIRAYQMIYENRLGGPQATGKKRRKRAQAEIADYVRDRLTPAMKRVLDDGLSDDDIRVRIQAFREAMKIERDESQLQLQEEKQDAELENLGREQLIVELFELVGEASTATAIGGISGEEVEGSATEITEAEEVIEKAREKPGSDDSAGSTPRVGNSAGTPKDGNKLHRSSNGDGRGRPTRDSGKRPNPITEAARRRASKR